MFAPLVVGATFFLFSFSFSLQASKCGDGRGMWVPHRTAPHCTSAFSNSPTVAGGGGLGSARGLRRDEKNILPSDGAIPLGTILEPMGCYFWHNFVSAGADECKKFGVFLERVARAGKKEKIKEGGVLRPGFAG